MIADSLDFDMILHIGAGLGEQAETWLDAGVKRIVLVEPNPACGPALRRLAAANPEVTVVQAALARYDGEGRLQMFSLPRHNSLRKPAGLIDLLPGLRELGDVAVPTLTASSLLAESGDLSGKVAVILDAPGSELEILQGLDSAGALERLTRLQMICNEEPLYHGAAGRPALQDLLEQAGFSLTGRDLSDPDWPHLTFSNRQQARKITFQTTRLQVVSAAVAPLHSHQQGAADANVSDRGRAILTLGNQLHSYDKAEDDRLAGQLDVTTLRPDRETLQKERDAAVQKAQSLEARLARDKNSSDEHTITIRRQAQLIDEAKAAAAARQAVLQLLETALTEEQGHKAGLLAQVHDQHAMLTKLQTAQSEQQIKAIALHATIADLQDQKIAIQSQLDDHRNLQAELTASLHQSRTETAAKTQALARQADRIKELEFRQGQAREELRRFEGQMDLIKDLLLRGERL